MLMCKRTVGPQWPSNGEIDIIEGVNSQQSNSMALHTNPGCSINNFGGAPGADAYGPGRQRFSGAIKTPNCDINAPGQGTNVGCAIASADDSTYGDGFNNAGGGVYATEWTAEAISVYHFSRANVPVDLSSGTPDPSTWGTPLAVFNGCDFKRSVANQTIVFNVAFCGQWAGQDAVWKSDAVCSQKAPTCQEYVANNPGAFANSFWEVNSLKVFQQQDGPAIPIPQPPPAPSAPGALPSSQAPPPGVPPPSTLSTVASPPGEPGVPPPRTSTVMVTSELTTTITVPVGQTPVVPAPLDGCHDGVPGGCISRRPGRRPRPSQNVPVGQAASGCIGRGGRGCDGA